MNLTSIRTTAIALAIAVACTPTFAADPAPAPDAAALATLMAVNDHEIKAAKLALDKKVSAPVAEYARMMDKEHSDNQRLTRQVADDADVKPKETPDVEALKSKSKASREQLETLQGNAFEMAYVDAMVKDHGEVLQKLDGQLIPGAKNEAVAQHLRMTRDHVAMHLERAKALDAGASR